jgi:hypothetical protein
MFAVVRSRPWFGPIVWLGLLLAACQTQLVPAYDETLVADLVQADEKALVLFSAVGDGSDKAEFPKFAGQYEQLIGKFGSLQNRADARPSPPLAKRLAEQLAKYDVLKKACSDAQGDPGSCVNSSPRALGTIVENLTKMRATHKAGGLAKDVVPIFKNAYAISIHQTMTVEMALKRGPEAAQ